MKRNSNIASNNLPAVSLAALGVVYGDIGTSPLYALRESLHGIPVITNNIFGILSLIFWSLMLVISIKYLVLILSADNDGEGGVLALIALLKRRKSRYFMIFFIVGMLGAGLLLGDGMVTPAISVISAVEGLKILTPLFSHWVIPITVIILIFLFLSQQHGTAKIGKYFGPVILVWFITIGILGVYRIIENPEVLVSINPKYAINFFQQNGLMGYFVLGGVFLVVTGGEALYADLGHFGKKPIRLSWFFIVLPGLILNYFGQGAYLLNHHEAIINPFYAIAPDWFRYPLILLATLATIIASQAVISATFSLTKQGILLDLLPRLPIIQTSETKKGQIYVPQMNMILALGSLLLVFTFKNSSALTHAYGIAVNLEMLGLTFLVTYIAYTYWKWSLIKIILIFSIFILIDLAYLGANAHKIITGGWVPLLFAIICAGIMMTWKSGITFLRSTFYKEKMPLKKIIAQIDYKKLHFLPNKTAIFMADPYDKSGGGLLHYLKLNNILPENIVIVSIVVKSHPYVSKEERYEFHSLNKNFNILILHYGFMDEINVPRSLLRARRHDLFPFILNMNELTYLIEIPSVVATPRKQTLYFYWQEKLFAFLMRNAALDIEFFKLPYNKTIAIGTYCEI